MPIAQGLFTLVASGYLLVIGKSILLPLVIAVFLWFLIRALADALRSRLGFLPVPLSYLLSSVLLLLLVLLPIQLVAASVPAVIAALPAYEVNLFLLLEKVMHMLDLDMDNTIKTLRSHLDISGFLTSVANGITGFISNALLVLVYVAFLFAEQGIMRDKIGLLAGDAGKEKSLATILAHINKRVTTYVWVKAQLSFLTALTSYAVMVAVGLDFASFWAMVVFIFNFIPNLGSIIGTLFPALLALVQFDTFTPVLVILGGVGAIQFVVGNVLEPRLMGSSLNLSPFAILVSLILWGTIWGVTGLFLSVPMTVILMIILAEFPATRPVSILLSGDGKV